MWKTSSCKSSYVVYLVTCNICNKQYTGSTTETIGLCHASHRTEIKNKSTPLGRHFSYCGLENFSLQLIDCVKQGENDALEVLEGFWSHRLATFQVHGNINKRDEMTRKKRKENSFQQ